MTSPDTDSESGAQSAVAPPAPAPATPRPAGASPARRRWARRILLPLGPAVVLLVAGYYYYSGGRYIGTDNAYVKADKVMVAAEVSGLIADVAVRENQRVERGDVLFRIDDRRYRIALDEAEAELAGMAGEIASLKASYRAKVEELALLRTNLDFSQKDLDRQASLMASSTTTRSRFDAARHEVDANRQRMRVVEQEMAEIRARLGGDPNIDVTQHPKYRHLKAAADRAALDLERTVVLAPLSGIASNTPQVGQQVTGIGALSSPVMSIVAADDVWIEANLKETDLTFAVPGQPVTILVDTYPDHEWQGMVASISQATGAEFSVIPAQNATGNWVKVVQRIAVRIHVTRRPDDPPLRVGMSTTVAIDTGRRRPMPGLVRAAMGWVDIAPTASAAEAGSAR